MRHVPDGEALEIYMSRNSKMTNKMEDPMRRESWLHETRTLFDHYAALDLRGCVAHFEASGGGGDHWQWHRTARRTPHKGQSPVTQVSAWKGAELPPLNGGIAW